MGNAKCRCSMQTVYNMLDTKLSIVDAAARIILEESEHEGQPLDVILVPRNTGRHYNYREAVMNDPAKTADEMFVSNKYGYFSFVNCETFHGISSNLTPAQRQRLMYLMAYCNKYGMLERQSKNIPADLLSNLTTEEWVMSIFDLQPRAMNNLMDTLCDNGALVRRRDFSQVERGGKIYNTYEFSRDLLYKGRMTKNEIDLTEGGQSRYIRLFEQGVRALYRTERGREVMKYLPLIILCVNSYNNVLCYNPLENDPAFVEIITFPQACEVMGYSDGSCGKIRKSMLETTFHTQLDGYEHVCIQTDREVLGLPAGSYFINPRIYTGAGKDAIMELAPLFKAKERKT